MYTVDYAERITNLSDSGLASNTFAYTYDLLDRLKTGTSTAISRGYTYDANGNRLTTTGTNASTETVATTNNRLSSTSGSIVRTYGYDAAGNTSSYTGDTFTFNKRGRLASVTVSAGATTYTYNALNQLIEKAGNGGGTYFFVYDERGHLLGEYTSSGSLIEETIWLDDLPVATLRPNGSTVSIYYVHSDHIGTPRKVTRPSDNALMWRWDPDTFGSVAANQNPAALGTFAYNLRYPGQYYLAETGLHYNYFRDYDPQMGRYVESDPIGLGGSSFSTYAYVNGNPVLLIDPYGLWDWPSLPQGVVNASAGFGDTLSFGLTNQIRNLQGTNGVVDKCSNSYTAGQVAAIALDVGLGGAAGMAASEANAGHAGYEFSHWIPNRFGGPRSPWNGNYVSQELHYLTDPYRFPPGWQQYGDKLPAALQQLLRIPGVYPGAAAGGGAGAASAASQSCGCQK